MSTTNIGFLSPAILDERLKREKDYWLEKLSGGIVAAGLPLDYRRPEIFSDEKHSTSLVIDEETQGKLLTICEHKELLVFAALVTALKICLYKYTGIEAVTVGSTIHERYKELALLNKVLVLQDRVDGAMTGKQLLLNVKRTLSEAYSNQKYPFQRLLELLPVESADSYEKLFNVSAIMTNFNNRENIARLQSDINLIFSMGDGSVTGVIESNSNLFAKETVEIFGVHFNEILRQLLTHPDRHISEFGLLSADKKWEFITDFNNTSSNYPLSSCIHHLFEAQVQRTPSALAARLASPSPSALASLTFAQLDERANQLSHYLIDSGIRPHSVVALLLDHSCETLIAILGVLKAGCAYLPLDPAHPPARMAFALADAEAALLITTHSLQERLSAGIAAHLPTLSASEGMQSASRHPESESTSASTPPSVSSSMPPVLSLDTDWHRCASLPAVRPSLPPLTSSAAAYLIYTSGSTGVPKGVVIEHSSLINYICWAQSVYFDEGEQADCALYSSLAFDLTVTSLFLPLVSGHTVWLYPQQDAAPSLLEVMADNRTHLLKLTPSHLSLIRDADNRNSVIRRLIVGG
ncbi:MAG TPA: AMP-binding protein, partial [Pyrinomonadaceae bacterium]|nr:AMP-binding protein [Pyrinomonadaceae bacterium]